jgi:hypothetical protein
MFMEPRRSTKALAGVSPSHRPLFSIFAPVGSDSLLLHGARGSFEVLGVILA